MTITIDQQTAVLAPWLEEGLRQVAARQGQEPAEYVKTIVEQAIRGHGFMNEATLGSVTVTAEPPAQAPTPGTLRPDTPPVAQPGRPVLTAADLQAIRDRPRPRILADIRPRIAAPAGSNGFDQIIGKWPGDETEEELLAALKAMG